MVKKLEEKVRELSRKSDEDKQRMLEKLREQNQADLKRMQKETQDALAKQLDDIKKQVGKFHGYKPYSRSTYGLLFVFKLPPVINIKYVNMYDCTLYVLLILVLPVLYITWSIYCPSENVPGIKQLKSNPK